MSSAFISYSRKDKAVADFIAAELRNRDVDVFVDYQNLRTGNFMSRLGQQIEQKKYFIVVLSPHSVSSKWVQAEVAWAFTNKGGDYIIPIRLESVSMTDLFVLASLETVDFTRWNVDRAMDEAIQKLARLMNAPREPIKSEPVPEPMLRENMMNEQRDNETEVLDENLSPAFVKGDVAKMFQSALATQDTDPERALFLYQQVLEIDPGFMGGKIKEFVEVQTEKTIPTRLYLLERKAEAAKEKGQWKQLEQLANSMIDIAPSDTYAREQIEIAKRNIKCEPFYNQAQSALQNENRVAVTHLMSYIGDTCPDYGDPARLLSNQPIIGELVSFVHNSHTLARHTGPVKQVIFSFSGSMLATTSADDTVKIWSVSSGTLLKEFRCPANTLSFSRDERFLAVAVDGGSVNLFRVEGWEIVQTFQGDSECNDLVFSRDSKILITGWEAGGLKVHNVPKITAIHNTVGTEYGQLESLVLSEGDLLFANFRYFNGRYAEYIGRIWNTSDWEKVRIIAFENARNYIPRKNVSLSPDGIFLACQENDAVMIRELPEGSEYWKYHEYGNMPAVHDFTLSPSDSSLIILAGENSNRGRLLFYDMVTNQRIADLEGHFDTINSVAMSRDGRFIATGSDDCRAKIWQL